MPRSKRGKLMDTDPFGNAVPRQRPKYLRRRAKALRGRRDNVRRLIAAKKR